MLIGITRHVNWAGEESFLPDQLSIFVLNLCLNRMSHVKISQLVDKMCSQQACSKLVNKL